MPSRLPLPLINTEQHSLAELAGLPPLTQHVQPCELELNDPPLQQLLDPALPHAAPEATHEGFGSPLPPDPLLLLELLEQAIVRSAKNDAQRRNDGTLLVMTKPLSHLKYGVAQEIVGRRARHLSEKNSQIVKNVQC